MSEPENALEPSVSESPARQGSGAVPALRDLTGKTLGDFQVERLLGRGGMGEVYLARQISLNRQVALEVLRPDLLTNQTYLKRFEAEATAVAKLNHPNIVHVYTLGSIEGIRFIAMEYVQGANLREYLARKGALDLPQALSIMKQAGQAVGAAGELGLVHRDIKPENILLTRKGQVKITDFGLCRDQDAEHLNLTQSGVTMGTPLYMSPEQAQGHTIDHRSDLYSLGVTFYQMLAGQPPFRAETALAMALKHVKDTPASVSVHRNDLPPELDRLVMKLMAKDPSDRYQSAAEMLRDLSRVKDNLHAPSVALAVTEAMPAAVPTDGRTTAGVTRPPARPAKPAPKRERAQLPRVRIGAKTLTGIITLCLVVGAVTGWIARPEDLLAQSAIEPSAAPALWMVPGWETAVSRGNSPEAQYHYALFSAPKEDQEAAWIAVPGYYPEAGEWAVRAYIQLARTLLRRHDEGRLKVLAGEISRWNKTKTHEKELADIMMAGAKALSGDLDGVIEDFNRTVIPHALTDPALMELSLEVTQQAAREAARSGPSQTSLEKLREIQHKLYNELFETENRTRPLGPKAK